eukprot:1617180-Amphidinium_carterae.1
MGFRLVLAFRHCHPHPWTLQLNSGSLALARNIVDTKVPYAGSDACASLALASSISVGGTVTEYDGAACSEFACADYSDGGYAYDGSGDMP